MKLLEVFHIQVEESLFSLLSSKVLEFALSHTLCRKDIQNYSEVGLVIHFYSSFCNVSLIPVLFKDCTENYLEEFESLFSPFISESLWGDISGL